MVQHSHALIHSFTSQAPNIWCYHILMCWGFGSVETGPVQDAPKDGVRGERPEELVRGAKQLLHFEDWRYVGLATARVLGDTEGSQEP